MRGHSTDTITPTKVEENGRWSEFSTTALKIADELRQQYSFGEVDAPDRALGDYPNPTRVIEALKILIDVMFPGRFSGGISRSEELLPFISERLEYAAGLLGPEIERAVPFRWNGEAARCGGTAKGGDPYALAHDALNKFFEGLSDTRRLLVLDVKAAYHGDPAALSFAEIKVAYPGLLAIASHRLAHRLYKLDVPIVPRIMSEWTHTQTGIDIHPGAVIGESFFIDHGTGVVIGETARIGARVKMYQGATLGAKSFPLDECGQPVKHIQRHPTVEDDVVIYANGIVLGGDTVIGSGSTIGSGVSVMESVPPNSVVLANRMPPEVRESSKRNKS